MSGYGIIELVVREHALAVGSYLDGAVAVFHHIFDGPVT